MVYRLFNRIYADFLMPSRLGEYEALLKKAKKRGYHICSIKQFWEYINKNQIYRNEKYLILRHDIDTDSLTAKEMFRIEKHLNVFSSYYFRLSTIDVPFMKQIDSYGSEASYHYEEIASFAKSKHIKKIEEIYSSFDEIKRLFIKNITYLRNITGLNMEIVASHGDFVNRYLKISNTILLDDMNFRKENGIVFEVYDRSMMDLIDKRHSDMGPPNFWKPDNPNNSINNDNKVIYMLTHPRHWRVNIYENIKDDIRRMYEGVFY